MTNTITRKVKRKYPWNNILSRGRIVAFRPQTYTKCRSCLFLLSPASSTSFGSKAFTPDFVTVMYFQATVPPVVTRVLVTWVSELVRGGSTVRGEGECVRWAGTAILRTTSDVNGSIFGDYRSNRIELWYLRSRSDWIWLWKLKSRSNRSESKS